MSEDPVLEKTTIFTMTGCPHCDDLLVKFDKEIAKGQVDVKNCNPKGNQEEVQNCEIAVAQEDFDGFPSMYEPDGKKIL